LHLGLKRIKDAKNESDIRGVRGMAKPGYNYTES